MTMYVHMYNVPFPRETYIGKFPLQDISEKVRKRNPTKAARVIQNIITTKSEKKEDSCCYLHHR